MVKGILIETKPVSGSPGTLVSSLALVTLGFNKAVVKMDSNVAAQHVVFACLGPAASSCRANRPRNVLECTVYVSRSQKEGLNLCFDPGGTCSPDP